MVAVTCYKMGMASKGFSGRVERILQYENLWRVSVFSASVHMF